MKNEFNFTASFLDNFGIKILDELGYPISTIYYSKERYDFPIRKPSLSYDILKKASLIEEKEPELKKITDMKKLEEMGIVICAVPLPKNTIWVGKRRFRTMYALMRKGSQEEKIYKKVKSLKSGTFGSNYTHAVIYDEANKKAKLVGEKSGPLGEGDWVYI